MKRTIFNPEWEGDLPAMNKTTYEKAVWCKERQFKPGEIITHHPGSVALMKLSTGDWVNLETGEVRTNSENARGSGDVSWWWGFEITQPVTITRIEQREEVCQ